MNLVILSSFKLAEEYSDIRNIVETNQPLTENNIPVVLDKCQDYAKKNNLTFLYPMGITPIYFIFKQKGTPGRKAVKKQ